MDVYDIEILPTLRIKEYKFVLVTTSEDIYLNVKFVDGYFSFRGNCLCGKWIKSNHSGLGNALKKAGFLLGEIKKVYAFLKQTS